MSSVKDDYIREIISKIDNVFLRRRLKQELSAHFDDTLASLSFGDPSSMDHVIREMGEPSDIAGCVNRDHPSILGRVYKTFDQNKMAILVLVLCLMSGTMILLNHRLNQSLLTIDHLDHQIDNLSTKVKQIDTLRMQLAQLENGNEMTFLLANNYNQNEDDYQPVNIIYSVAHGSDASFTVGSLRPLSLPIYVQIYRKVPDQVQIEEKFGTLRFIYENNGQSHVFMLIELKTQSQMAKSRSKDGLGQLRLLSSDIDLNNGLYVTETLPSLSVDSGLSLNQISEIQSLLHSISLYVSNDYSIMVSNY